MEIIGLLMTAKEMGFEAGQLIAFISIYVLLKREFGKQFQKLIEAINSLEQTHNERLKKIENHIGLK